MNRKIKISINPLLLFLLLFSISVSCPFSEDNSPDCVPSGNIENCNNNIDDNCDGKTDCADEQCISSHAPCGTADGNYCSANGTCEKGCMIDDQYYPADTPDISGGRSECAFCKPDTNPHQWTILTGNRCGSQALRDDSFCGTNSCGKSSIVIYQGSPVLIDEMTACPCRCEKDSGSCKAAQPAIVEGSGFSCVTDDDCEDGQSCVDEKCSYSALGCCVSNCDNCPFVPQCNETEPERYIFCRNDSDCLTGTTCLENVPEVFADPSGCNIKRYIKYCGCNSSDTEWCSGNIGNEFGPTCSQDTIYSSFLCQP